MAVKCLMVVLSMMLFGDATLLYAKEIVIEGNQELILDRIVADSGEGNGVEVRLFSVQPGYKTKANIVDLTNYPATTSERRTSSYSSDSVIVAKSQAITKGPFPGSGLNVAGEFFIDGALNLLMDGVWNGAKNGAKHTIAGSLKLYDYQFASDEKNPLVFLITAKGYVFQAGKGKVKDLKNGDIYILDR